MKPKPLACGPWEKANNVVDPHTRRPYRGQVVERWCGLKKIEIVAAGTHDRPYGRNRLVLEYFTFNIYDLKKPPGKQHLRRGSTNSLPAAKATAMQYVQGRRR